MDKKERIKELESHYKGIVQKVKKIKRLPEPKRESTKMKRFYKLLEYQLKARQCINQISNVLSQPEFQKGSN